MAKRGGSSGKSGNAKQKTVARERLSYNTGLTEEAFDELIDRANSEGDESLFPRLPGRGGAYVYEGSGGILYIYDPKNPLPDFSEEARISRKQLKFRKS